MQMDPLRQYQQVLSTTDYRADPKQAEVIEKLQTVYEQLVNSDETAGHFSWKKLLKNKSPQVQGLYLWGGTGRGKTWLMDLFYSCIPFSRKYRVHFHRFMLDIHEQLKYLPKSPDPLEIVARQLAEKYRLLCLDEFHVHDIADAMLMSGLLKALFRNGVTLVATSNIAINDLYKNGLQRDRFVSAIALLNRYTEEIRLDGDRDYRLEILEKNKTYQVVETGQGTTGMMSWFEKIAVVTPKHHRSIVVNGRAIRYISMADDLIWFDFNELCATYRSANDYIEIARMFHTVFISDIYTMNEAHDDVAKRFIHLIDALYDHQVNIIVTSQVEASSLYNGKRLSFAFERTISRLAEMGTERYVSLAHID